MNKGLAAVASVSHIVNPGELGFRFGCLRVGIGCVRLPERFLGGIHQADGDAIGGHFRARPERFHSFRHLRQVSQSFPCLQRWTGSFLGFMPAPGVRRRSLPW